MNSIDQKSEAMRLLDGLENGTMDADDSMFLAEKIDPALFYLLVKFLRACYPASDPAAEAVLGRVVQLTSSGVTLVRKFKEGEQDPISQWFEMDHTFQDFRARGRELVDVVVEKLET